MFSKQQKLHEILSQGILKKYVSNSSTRFYAMKLIDQEFILQNQKQGIVQNERDIMTVLDHPFILKLEYAFKSNNFIVFLLEFCSGGEQERQKE